MRSRLFAAVMLCVCLGACSDGGSKGAAAAGSSPAAAAPVKKQVAARSRPSAPPVRLFAGVQSVLGSLQQFCRGTRCDQPAAGTRRVAIPDRSVVTFAVDSVPDLAVVEVGGTGARRVGLAPGTLMALPGALAVGTHRMTLQLRWGSSVGTWAFDVVVRRAS